MTPIHFPTTVPFHHLIDVMLLHSTMKMFHLGIITYPNTAYLENLLHLKLFCPTMHCRL